MSAEATVKREALIGVRARWGKRVGGRGRAGAVIWAGVGAAVGVGVGAGVTVGVGVGTSGLGLGVCVGVGGTF